MIFQQASTVSSKTANQLANTYALEYNFPNSNNSVISVNHFLLIKIYVIFGVSDNLSSDTLFIVRAEYENRREHLFFCVKS